MSGAFIFPPATGTATAAPSHDVQAGGIVDPGEAVWHNNRLYANTGTTPVNVGSPVDVSALEDVTTDRTGAEEWYATIATRDLATFTAADVDNLYGVRFDNSLWRLTNHAPTTFAKIGGAAASVSDTVVVANIPADTWTPVPSTAVTNVVDFNVLGAFMVAQRIVSGVAQIRSSAALTNVTVNLQG